MADLLPQPPLSLKSISHFMKVAIEHDQRDPVVAYWARLHATQKALSIDKSSPEGKDFLIRTLDWLETYKKANKENEAVTNETVAQAHIENYALKLFSYADECDRKGVFNKNVVKAFYTSSILIDVLENFGELGEDFEKMRKYGKWKAAYIHNCLKSGTTPISGESEEYSHPHHGGNNDDDQQPAGSSNNSQPADAFPPPQNYYQPAAASSYYEETQPAVAAAESSKALPADAITLAQKYCKFASSSLNFDDVPTAIENLKKALALLEN